ncbi:MAG: alpha-rhamnosidase, partial [Bacteroidaceae bacterium]|nr:alpha-rhamnosidase [Bacteroidaceae bacterium]
MMNKFFILLCLSLMMVSCTSSSLEIGDLRCENLDNPLAIDNMTPHFSWILQSKKQNAKQIAYQILVASEEKNLTEEKADLWNSGKVELDKSNGVRYDGSALKSRSFCYW